MSSIISRGILARVCGAVLALAFGCLLASCAKVELAPHLMPMSRDNMMLLGKKGMEKKGEMMEHKGKMMDKKGEMMEHKGKTMGKKGEMMQKKGDKMKKAGEMKEKMEEKKDDKH